MSGSGLRIGATEIKRLAGGSFRLNNLRSSQPVRFEVLHDVPGGPKITPGAEAYGVCIDGDLGSVLLPAFLKVFKHRVDVRNRRNQFLVAQGLATRHWMFRGVPFGFLKNRRIQGVDVHGNLSFRIRGQDGQIAPSLANLLANDQWSFGANDRARFCGQICCAIHALEEIGLVHGDISLGNVVLGTDGKQQPAAVLVDYDGFYHPQQPLLPLKVDRYDIRKIGSPGFLDPCVLEDSARDPEKAFVRSDRVALGALVFQLIVWQGWMASELRRYHLLTDDMIRSRTVDGLPNKIIDIWPQGLELLRKALSARAPGEKPSPLEWLAAIGGPAIGPPFLVVSNRQLRPKVHQIVQVRNPSGTLAKIHPQLAPVRFTRQGHRVVLGFDWQAPIVLPVRSGARLLGNSEAELVPGLSVASNHWKFELKSNYR